MLQLLAALKIGFFLPAPDAPVYIWPYVGHNLTRSVEIGVTMEPRKYTEDFFGHPAKRMEYAPTFLIGLRKPLSKEIDGAVGAKFNMRTRHVGPEVMPYAGGSFRFGGLRA